MRVMILLAFLALPACGSDKVLHMMAGAGTGVVADKVNGMGCEAAIAIGIAKELIDPVFSTLDVIATSVYCLTLLDQRGNTP